MTPEEERAALEELQAVVAHGRKILPVFQNDIAMRRVLDDVPTRIEDIPRWSLKLREVMDSFQRRREQNVKGVPQRIRG